MALRLPGLKSQGLLRDDVQRHVDIAARRVRVRTDDMRRIHQFFGFRCVHPFNVDVQLRFDTKTGWQRANPHFAFNKGVFWQSELSRAATNFIAPRKQAE